MWMDDCRTTLTVSCLAMNRAERILSRLSLPKTSTRARLDVSVRAESAASSSSISFLPLIPVSLNRSSPTRVIEDCCDEFHVNQTLVVQSSDTTHPNPPPGIEHTVLKLRQEEIDGLVGVVCNDHPPSSHGGIPNKIFRIREASQNWGDDLRKMRLEPRSERGRQEYQESHESLLNRATG